MNEWIKCSERMPEYGVGVLLSTKDGLFVGYFWHYGWEVCNVIGVNYDMANITISSQPTHWMPLPSPPEDD